MASIDWTTCIALLDPAGEDHLLDTLGARTTETPAHAQATHRDPAQIEELIITQVAQHVDMRPEALPLDRSLTHLGLDSLGGYALHGILQSAGVTLSIEDMLGASTVAELIASARHSDAPARAEAHPTTSVSEPVTTPARAPGEAFNLKHVEGSKANQWFVNHTPERTGTHRLICFPYAGGNPSVFGGWARHLPDHVELCSLQLPARGARLHEPPVHKMRSLIDALIEAYRELDDTPTSFFGHCFGALMMFELAQRCRQEGLPLPKNLFISAARNPKSYTPAQLAADIEQYSPQPPLQLPELDDDALVDALKEMRFADSVDALDSKEIRRLLLPAVRADFAISNSYFYEETAPFEIPIFAMGGRADGYVTAMQLLSWREHTTAGFGHEYCNGGHYFIGDERDRWIERIVERIEL